MAGGARRSWPARAIRCVRSFPRVCRSGAYGSHHVRRPVPGGTSLGRDRLLEADPASVALDHGRSPGPQRAQRIDAARTGKGRGCPCEPRSARVSDPPSEAPRPAWHAALYVDIVTDPSKTQRDPLSSISASPSAPLFAGLQRDDRNLSLHPGNARHPDRPPGPAGARRSGHTVPHDRAKGSSPRSNGAVLGARKPACGAGSPSDSVRCPSGIGIPSRHDERKQTSTDIDGDPSRRRSFRATQHGRPRLESAHHCVCEARQAQGP